MWCLMWRDGRERIECRVRGDRWRDGEKVEEKVRNWDGVRDVWMWCKMWYV